MAHQASERYDVVSTSNEVNVPAVERERQQIDYNDEVEVTLYLDGDGDVSSVSFKRFLTANGSLTIPASLRRRFDLSDDVLTVSFEATGKRFSLDDASGTVRQTVFADAHELTQLKAVTEVIDATADELDEADDTVFSQLYDAVVAEHE